MNTRAFTTKYKDQTGREITFNGSTKDFHCFEGLVFKLEGNQERKFQPTSAKAAPVQIDEAMDVDELQPVPEGVWSSCFELNHDYLLINTTEYVKDSLTLVETVLLLLVAYQHFLGLKEIAASLLLSSMKTCGFKIDRLDRPLDDTVKNLGWLQAAKAGRGTKYSLTDSGRSRAITLLAEKFRASALE